MKSALAVISGGMDSTTMLYENQTEIGEAVSFFYGSKHNDEEIRMARISCQRLNIPHTVIDLRSAFKDFKSALLEVEKKVPEGHYEDESMKDTVVPFRNGIMLSVAAGLAESRGLDIVMIANHAGDHAVYPDCRADFMATMNSSVLLGTGGKVHIIAPYTYLDKEQIALIGDAYRVPWDETYSCYNGGEYHCGRCSTCVERMWALRNCNDTTTYLDTEYAKEVMGEQWT